jgi:hypothetical protein
VPVRPQYIQVGLVVAFSEFLPGGAKGMYLSGASYKIVGETIQVYRNCWSHIISLRIPLSTTISGSHPSVVP